MESEARINGSNTSGGLWRSSSSGDRTNEVDGTAVRRCNWLVDTG